MERDTIRNRWAVGISVFCGVVALVLLGLSVRHLSAGLDERNHDGFLWNLALSIGVDFSIVAMEAAYVLASVLRIRNVKGLALGWLGVSLSTSAVLNAQVYTEGLAWLTNSVGFNAFLGLFIPLGVFMLAKVGTAIVVGEREDVILLPRNGEEPDLETLRLMGNISRGGYRKRSRKPERV